MTIWCILKASSVFLFVWFSRAVERLDAARAHKEIPESTRTIKQQELHKALRVRQHAFMMLCNGLALLMLYLIITVLFRM